MSKPYSTCLRYALFQQNGFNYNVYCVYVCLVRFLCFSHSLSNHTKLFYFKRIYWNSWMLIGFPLKPNPMRIRNLLFVKSKSEKPKQSQRIPPYPAAFNENPNLIMFDFSDVQTRCVCVRALSSSNFPILCAQNRFFIDGFWQTKICYIITH